MTTESKDRLCKFIGGDLSSLITKIRELGVELSELEAERDYLADMKKVKLTDLIEDHRIHLKAQGEKITEAKLLSLATTDSRYQLHLVKLRDVTRKAGEKRQEYYEHRHIYESALEQVRNWRVKQRNKIYHKNGSR